MGLLTANAARGHIVMFTAPDMPGVYRLERCVAIPGDTIAIKDKALLIDGKRVLETFAVHRDPDIVRASADAVRDNLQDINLAPGQFFMLADDRDASVDSRYFGPVSSDFNPWKSCRDLLVQSGLQHRDAILATPESPRSPNASRLTNRCSSPLRCRPKPRMQAGIRPPSR